MDYYFYRKSLAIIIMLIFFWVNIIPNISGYNKLFYENKVPLNVAFNYLDDSPYKHQKTNFNKTELIEEYTWSVLRYGLRSDMPCSINFGNIYYARPSPGTSLILSAMMSKLVCHTALSINHENKRDTLLALEDYDIKNMIHTQTAFFYNYSEWNTPLISAYRRETVDEMKILGDICFIGNLVGNCYAQASFNTAVLRLCGFGPEEVFNIGIKDHTVNIVQVDGQWYVLDSTNAIYVKLGLLDSIISKFYDPSKMKMINFLENDKYFINFGTKYPDNYQNQDPYLFNLFCNMNGDKLLKILKEIIPMFNNSTLGIPEIEPIEFIEKAVPCPEMDNISIPYTINDAVGLTIQEKAYFLTNLIKSFILNHTGENIKNQYDRSLYVTGLLSVDYPQVYANAAKYAAWTSYLGKKLDTFNPIFDLLITGIWIRITTKTLAILPEGYIAFADLLYLRHAGSSIDQALLAYGTIRNMKKNSDLWQSEDLYIIITEDYEGCLAVNATRSWNYINFGNRNLVSNKPPSNIMIAFNEIECLSVWNE